MTVVHVLVVVIGGIGGRLGLYTWAVVAESVLSVAVVTFVMVRVTVVFAKYDDHEIKSVWKAKIEHSILLDKICGNTSFSSSTGVVSSPRLPFNYQKRVNCLYTIDSGQLNSFILSIDSMRLGNDHDRDGNCNRGSLIVSSQSYFIYFIEYLYSDPSR